MKIPEKLEILEVDYDAEADVLYLLLSRNPVQHTRPVDHGIIMDFDADENPVGIEVLWCRDQVVRWLMLPKPDRPNDLNPFGGELKLIPREEVQARLLGKKLVISEKTMTRIGRRLKKND